VQHPWQSEAGGVEDCRTGRTHTDQDLRHPLSMPVPMLQRIQQLVLLDMAATAFSDHSAAELLTLGIPWSGLKPEACDLIDTLSSGNCGYLHQQVSDLVSAVGVWSRRTIRSGSSTTMRLALQGQSFLLLLPEPERVRVQNHSLSAYSWRTVLAVLGSWADRAGGCSFAGEPSQTVNRWLRLWAVMRTRLVPCPRSTFSWPPSCWSSCRSSPP